MPRYAMPSKVSTFGAGRALLIDYRLKHRGLGNGSTDERPLIYLTYARPFWLDIHNFDKKRYPTLPEAPPPPPPATPPTPPSPTPHHPRARPRRPPHAPCRGRRRRPPAPRHQMEMHASRAERAQKRQRK